MRFVRFGEPGQEKPGLLLDDGSHRAVDLAPLGIDIDGGFLADLPVADLEALAGAVVGAPVVDIDGVRLGPPIARPSAIYAIGVNYRDHAAETGMAAPAEPIVFSKSTNSLCGCTDRVTLPRGAEKGDWEAELGVVIARSAFELVSPEEAAGVVGGYVAANDVSERRLQMEGGGQWLRGKSFPTACPLGPWLSTPDEIADPEDLRVSLAVNGVVKQDGTTADMIFTVPEIIWHLSQYLRLEPGDLIVTGTPAGVGLGSDPPVFLQDGDVMSMSITHLGSLRNTVHIPAQHGRGERSA
ncbi:MAG: fumarylacetoacetate hydrolase family protein [Nocardioidaceae bacterium]|jgi:2-keto-4-pentenoate hydratase/2-oxohepta-3-ene-1,7-dioic acid hydratase in catechol pathway|nr:fumarylacetoacetate hydrolase family protein [Nocardioidaceae bacterium]